MLTCNSTLVIFFFFEILMCNKSFSSYFLVLFMKKYKYLLKNIYLQTPNPKTPSPCLAEGILPGRLYSQSKTEIKHFYSIYYCIVKFFSILKRSGRRRTASSSRSSPSSRMAFPSGCSGIGSATET